MGGRIARLTAHFQTTCTTIYEIPLMSVKFWALSLFQNQFWYNRISSRICVSFSTYLNTCAGNKISKQIITAVDNLPSVLFCARRT